MSTPTEAHYDLRRQVIFSDVDDGAELIADSEARAVAAAVTALTCTHHNDQQRAACPVCRVTTLTAELAKERARLDSGQILLTVAGERVWHCGVDLRVAIDAAMKEDAK